MSAGGGVQSLFGQCPNAEYMNAKGYSLNLPDVNMSGGYNMCREIIFQWNPRVKIRNKIRGQKFPFVIVPSWYLG